MRNPRGNHDVPGASAMRRGFVLGLSLVLMLAGCVSSGKVGTDIWHSLTPAERAEADVLEQAMAKLAAKCREQNPKDPCVPPSVIVTWSGTTPHYGPGHIISVPRLALDPRARAIMAHELSHAWYADSRDDCRNEQRLSSASGMPMSTASRCSWTGTAMTNARRSRMMWMLLTVAVKRQVKPSRAHPDWCAELHDYERRTDERRVASHPCEERAAR